MVELLVTLVFLLGLITIAKSVLNMTGGVLTWVVIGIIIYTVLMYFNIP